MPNARSAPLVLTLLVAARALGTPYAPPVPNKLAVAAAQPSPRTVLPSRWRRLNQNVDRLRQSGVAVTLTRVPMSQGPEMRTVGDGRTLGSASITYADDSTLAHELQHLSDQTRGVRRPLLQSEVAANYAATGDSTKAVDLTALNHQELKPSIDALRLQGLSGGALFRSIIRGAHGVRQLSADPDERR